MSIVTDLRAAVKVLYGGELSPLLRQLSNVDGNNSASTIDDTVLDAHCEMTLGRFQMETGYKADLGILAHKNILIIGVRASLEESANRDSNIARNWDIKFRNLLITFKKRIRGKMKSSSNLTPSERPAQLPDADPMQVAFSVSKRRGSRIPREFNN